MKYVLSIVLLILVSTSAIADEPPSWDKFEIYSSNRHYLAKVTVVDGNEKSERSGWKYKLTVYETKGSTNSELWSCSYLYDGYSGGLLSDDGTTFVYMNFWYYEKSPIVTVYQQGELKKEFTGEELNLDRSKLTRTVSHRIWWHPTKVHGFVCTTEMPLGLEINTIDSQQIIVNLKSFDYQ
jgi:hypothetical protein